MSKRDKVDPFEAFAIDVFHDAWKKGEKRVKEFEIVSYEVLKEPLLIRVKDESNCPFHGLKDSLCNLSMCSCYGVSSEYCLLNSHEIVNVSKVS